MCVCVFPGWCACGFIDFGPAHAIAFQFIKSHLVSGVSAFYWPLFLCVCVVYIACWHALNWMHWKNERVINAYCELPHFFN